MSLHARITDEARASLAAQRRNSTISSIIIALLSFTLIGIILAVLFTKFIEQKAPIFETYVSTNQDDPPINRPEIKNAVKSKPSARSASASPVITTLVPSTLSINVPDTATPSMDIGDGDFFGDSGIGEDDGPGFDGLKNFTGPTRSRCSKQERMARLARTGGTPACEDAVVKSLRWLKETQNADGSWCKSKQVGMTGLALLSYLGHCETPHSVEFGESVEDAINYLIANGLKQNGKLSADLADRHWPYEHAIATYALAEAYTFCAQIGYEIPELESTLNEATEIIVKGQHQSGAWDYNYDNTDGRKGDTSIACWHLQALKAYTLTNLDYVDVKKAAKLGLEYLERCQNDQGAIGYAGKKSAKYTMTGAGVLCYQQWAKGSSLPARRGLNWINDNVDFKYDEKSADLYAHYYHSQAMMNAGGDSWKQYNEKFRDEVLAAQLDNGSFKVPANGKPHAVAPKYAGGANYALHYRTCLNTLMLEVYYRFLPSAN